VHQDALEFMERVLPHNLRKLKLYDDPTVPLFTRYQIESQIESAFNHKVSLPSGGSIVIDRTEALTAIDINSARSTKGEDIEETALNTNLEAADEIGRQLRIRDLGGLVVVDFIDMGPQRNQRDVENRLRDAVKHDRARIQIGRISRFGLLELSRQRLRPSLEESTQSVCPRCNGAGNVRSVESLALAVLRLVGEEARKERTAKVIAELPLDVANYVLNEKRDWVQSVQEANGVQIVLIGNPDLETPNYSLRRVRDDETTLPENSGTSYKLLTPKPDPSLPFQEVRKQQKTEEAAISNLLPSTPVPTPPPPPEPPARAPEAPAAPAAARPSLLSRLFGWLSAPPPAAPEPAPAARNEEGPRRAGQRDHSRGRDRDRDRDRDPRPHGEHRRERGDRGGRGGRNRGQRLHNDGGGQRPMREPGDGGNRPQEGRRDRGQQPQRSGQGPAQGHGQGSEPRPDQQQQTQTQPGQPGQGQQGQPAQGGGRSRRGRNRRGGRDDRQRGGEQARERRPEGTNGGQPPPAAQGDVHFGAQSPPAAQGDVHFGAQSPPAAQGDVHFGGQLPPAAQSDDHFGGTEPARTHDAPAERLNDSPHDVRVGSGFAPIEQTTDWEAHWVEPQEAPAPREARERPPEPSYSQEPSERPDFARAEPVPRASDEPSHRPEPEPERPERSSTQQEEPRPPTEQPGN
jgi:ribonuclease E